MVKTGNRLKWVTVAFSLLALMVLAYSASKLTLLYDSPLVGVSIESKLAKQKWYQLETHISEKVKNDWSKSISVLFKAVPIAKKKVQENNSSQEIQQVDRLNKETLPEISGIFKTSGTSQKTNVFIISQGNIYSENDEVSGYMIKKITEKGVAITKNGRNYFIDAPKAPYSIDQGK